MAPSLEEPHWAPQFNNLTNKLSQLNHKDSKPLNPRSNSFQYEPGHTTPEVHNGVYEHEDLRPHFPDLHWPALEEVPYSDRGIQGDEHFKNLLESATDVFDYNPKIGTEVHGVRLTELNDAAKDDLARLVATRGVVFFRNQDDFTIEEHRKLMSHFGRLHKHATTSTPRKAGLEDVHVVYTAEDARDMRAIFTPSFLWHSDVTYEVQPLAYTSLKLLTGPTRGGGGDTLWSSQYAAYDALSPQMQKYLESLTALHSADMQAGGSKALGRSVRRDPVTTEHPLVRTHPVTGWKALFFNPGFVTKIIGIPKTESDYMIKYLNEVIATTQELHVRFQWNKNDVAFWDNRICNHTASYGFAGHRRHAVRVGIHGEKPVLVENSKSQEDELFEKYGIPKVCKDGSGVVNYND